MRDILIPTPSIFYHCHLSPYFGALDTWRRISLFQRLHFTFNSSLGAFHTLNRIKPRHLVLTLSLHGLQRLCLLLILHGYLCLFPSCLHAHALSFCSLHEFELCMSVCLYMPLLGHILHREKDENHWLLWLFFIFWAHFHLGGGWAHLEGWGGYSTLRNFFDINSLKVGAF